MHEATVALIILDCLAKALSAVENGVAAQRATVRLGEFRNVDPESLDFAFHALRKEYPGLSECTLTIETVPAMALCFQAAHIYHASPEHAYRCSNCGSGIGKLLSGEELEISAIEVQVAKEETISNA